MDFTDSLKRNYEFRRAYQRGKSFAAPSLVVYCRRCGGVNNHLGLTVSNKIGNAVVRNRIRRRLREIYRLNEASLKRGMDIVVVARVRSASADYHRLEGDFLSACGELGILEKRRSD